MMARLVATAMPLSAPSVVPSALTRFPSRTSVIGSLAKSCTLPGRLTHTMSRWPCRQTDGRPSRPGEAGLRTTTLPPLSCWCGRRSPFATRITKAWAAASLPDSRGMRESCAK